MRLALLILLLPCAGCMNMGGGLAKVIRELAKDPATVDLEIQHPYGYFKLHRAFPGQSNATAVSVPVHGQLTIRP